MAKKPGISRVSVTAWENGTAKPDGEHLHQLAYALSPPFRRHTKRRLIAASICRTGMQQAWR